MTRKKKRRQQLATCTIMAPKIAIDSMTLGKKRRQKREFFSISIFRVYTRFNDSLEEEKTETTCFSADASEQREKIQ